MNKKKIQSDYNKKIKLINNLNKFYYEKSKPLVSDKEYDDLKKEILTLEKKKWLFKIKNFSFKNSWI